jgi:hypothetical protein
MIRCIRCGAGHNKDACPICKTPKDAVGVPRKPSEMGMKFVGFAIKKDQPESLNE